MKLSELAEQYALIRHLSPGAAYLMARTVTLFSCYLARDAYPCDLTDSAVSRWLESLESLRSQSTVAGHRTRILTLWHHCHVHGLAGPIGDVRRERQPVPQPVAWTVEQVQRLVAACSSVPGGVYLRLLILAAYQTGLRRGDLWRLRRDQIGTDGTIRIRQHKTGYPHEPRLEVQTAAEVLALPGAQPLACPWCTRTYTARWRRVRQLAALPDHGALQQLRRTGATAIACQYGLDAAREFLGHRSPEMVSHYVDRGLYHPRGWLPPRVA